MIIHNYFNRVLGDPWALQQAKFNAEFEYSVIGATEHWNVTLAVLQEYLPMFFSGSLQRYWSEGICASSHFNLFKLIVLFYHNL